MIVSQATATVSGAQYPARRGRRDRQASQKLIRPAGNPAPLATFSMIDRA
jgi:hypothetical protein